MKHFADACAVTAPCRNGIKAQTPIGDPDDDEWESDDVDDEEDEDDEEDDDDEWVP